MPPEAVHDTARPPICESFAEYVATLPPWEGDLLAHAMEEFYPESSFYELLQQKDANILVASDGSHKEGNRNERRSHTGLRRSRERLPNAVLPS
jgi:hypothetical protein